MKFLQQPIERKLTALVGAKVSFQKFSISPLAGRLEVEGMEIAGEMEGQPPLLKVRRIEAKVSAARALSGQLDVKSMVIERPELYLVRRDDGSLSIPRPVRISGGEEKEDDKSWEFEAQSILIKDGLIRLLRGDQISVIEEIQAEFKCDDRGRIDLAAIQLKGKTDLSGWLPKLPAATASVKVEISLPLNAIFPGGKN